MEVVSIKDVRGILIQSQINVTQISTNAFTIMDIIQLFLIIDRIY